MAAKEARYALKRFSLNRDQEITTPTSETSFMNELTSRYLHSPNSVQSDDILNIKEIKHESEKLLSRVHSLRKKNNDISIQKHTRSRKSVSSPNRGSPSYSDFPTGTRKPKAVAKSPPSKHVKQINRKRSRKQEKDLGAQKSKPKTLLPKTRREKKVSHQQSPVMPENYRKMINQASAERTRPTSKEIKLWKNKMKEKQTDSAVDAILGELKNMESISSLSHVINGMKTQTNELLESLPQMSNAVANMKSDTELAASELQDRIKLLVTSYREMNEIAARAPLSYSNQMGFLDGLEENKASPKWVPKIPSFDYEIVYAELNDIEARKRRLETSLGSLKTTPSTVADTNNNTELFGESRMGNSDLSGLLTSSDEIAQRVSRRMSLVSQEISNYVDKVTKYENGLRERGLYELKENEKKIRARRRNGPSRSVLAPWMAPSKGWREHSQLNNELQKEPKTPRWLRRPQKPNLQDSEKEKNSEKVYGNEENISLQSNKKITVAQAKMPKRKEKLIERRRDTKRTTKSKKETQLKHRKRVTSQSTNRVTVSKQIKGHAPTPEDSESVRSINSVEALLREMEVKNTNVEDTPATLKEGRNKSELKVHVKEQFDTEDKSTLLTHNPQATIESHSNDVDKATLLSKKLAATSCARLRNVLSENLGNVRKCAIHYTIQTMANMLAQSHLTDHESANTNIRVSLSGTINQFLHAAEAVYLLSNFLYLETATEIISHSIMDASRLEGNPEQFVNESLAESFVRVLISDPDGGIEAMKPLEPSEVASIVPVAFCQVFDRGMNSNEKSSLSNALLKFEQRNYREKACELIKSMDACLKASVSVFSTFSASDAFETISNTINAVVRTCSGTFLGICGRNINCSLNAAILASAYYKSFGKSMDERTITLSQAAIGKESKINGHPLTFAENTSVRAALSSITDLVRKIKVGNTVPSENFENNEFISDFKITSAPLVFRASEEKQKQGEQTGNENSTFTEMAIAKLKKIYGCKISQGVENVIVYCVPTLIAISKPKNEVIKGQFTQNYSFVSYICRLVDKSNELALIDLRSNGCADLVDCFENIIENASVAITQDISSTQKDEDEYIKMENDVKNIKMAIKQGQELQIQNRDTKRMTAEPPVLNPIPNERTMLNYVTSAVMAEVFANQQDQSFSLQDVDPFESDKGQKLEGYQTKSEISSMNGVVQTFINNGENVDEDVISQIVTGLVRQNLNNPGSGTNVQNRREINFQSSCKTSLPETLSDEDILDLITRLYLESLDEDPNTILQSEIEPCGQKSLVGSDTEPINGLPIAPGTAPNVTPNEVIEQPKMDEKALELQTLSKKLKEKEDHLNLLEADFNKMMLKAKDDQITRLENDKKDRLKWETEILSSFMAKIHSTAKEQSAKSSNNQPVLDMSDDSVPPKQDKTLFEENLKSDTPVETVQLISELKPVEIVSISQQTNAVKDTDSENGVGGNGEVETLSQSTTDSLLHESNQIQTLPKGNSGITTENTLGDTEARVDVCDSQLEKPVKTTSLNFDDKIESVVEKTFTNMKSEMQNEIKSMRQSSTHSDAAVESKLSRMEAELKDEINGVKSMLEDMRNSKDEGTKSIVELIRQESRNAMATFKVVDGIHLGTNNKSKNENVPSKQENVHPGLIDADAANLFKYEIKPSRTMLDWDNDSVDLDDDADSSDLSREDSRELSEGEIDVSPGDFSDGEEIYYPLPLNVTGAPPWELAQGPSKRDFKQLGLGFADDNSSDDTESEMKCDESDLNINSINHSGAQRESLNLLDHDEMEKIRKSLLTIKSKHRVKPGLRSKSTVSETSSLSESSLSLSSYDVSE